MPFSSRMERALLVDDSMSQERDVWAELGHFRFKRAVIQDPTTNWCFISPEDLFASISMLSILKRLTCHRNIHFSIKRKWIFRYIGLNDPSNWRLRPTSWLCPPAFTPPVPMTNRQTWYSSLPELMGHMVQLHRAHWLDPFTVWRECRATAQFHATTHAAITSRHPLVHPPSVVTAQ